MSSSLPLVGILSSFTTFVPTLGPTLEIESAMRLSMGKTWGYILTLVSMPNHRICSVYFCIRDLISDRRGAAKLLCVLFFFFLLALLLGFSGCVSFGGGACLPIHPDTGHFRLTVVCGPTLFSVVHRLTGPSLNRIITRWSPLLCALDSVDEPEAHPDQHPLRSAPPTFPVAFTIVCPAANWVLPTCSGPERVPVVATLGTPVLGITAYSRRR